MLYEMSMGYLVYQVISDERGAVCDLLIEVANDTVLENEALKEEEIIGQSVKDVFPEYADSLLKVCAEAITSGNQTCCIVYKEREEVYLKFVCFAQEKQRCTCVITDITDRFLTECSLEEAKEKYQSVIEASEEFIFELDLEGRFTYISEGIREVLGYEPEEFIGRYYYEQYPVDVRKSAAHTFQKHFNECGQQIQGLMTELLTKDGRHRFALQNGIVLMDENGRDFGYRGIYLDVTGIEKARRKAEELIETKTELVSKLSKEVRMPVTGMVELTSMALQEPRAYKAYGYLQQIEENAMNLLSMIGAMTEYSKLWEEDVKLSEEGFSLQQVLQKVICLLVGKAREKRVQLFVEVEEQVPDWYSGDHIRLEQVLTNLLSNAIHYTREGMVKLMVRKREKGLLFIIKDNSTVGKEYEMSLGMNISKQLIEAMGGRSKIVDTEKSGVRIYVALPLKHHSGEGNKKIDCHPVEQILQAYIQKDESEKNIACTKEKESGEMEYPFSHIDYMAAISKLGQDKKLYQQIINSFIKECSNEKQKLMEMIRMDQERALCYLHGMESSAQMIGAFELGAIAARVEEELKMGDIRQERIRLYEEELQEVIWELVQYGDAMAISLWDKGYNKREAGALLARIEKLSIDHDAAIVEEIKGCEEVLNREDVEEQVRKLVCEMEQYQFELVKGTVTSIRGALGVKE